MDWFWHVLLVCAVVVPVTVMWIAIIVELFRRRDLSGVARAGWLVILFVLPLIGSLLYVVVTWRRGEGDRGGTKAPAAVDRARHSTTSDLPHAGTAAEEQLAQGKGQVLEDGRGRHSSEGVGR